MRRLLGLLVPTALFALGAPQLAGGSWIYAKAILAQTLLERAWQRTLDGEERVRPWPWADTWPVARLEIPGLDTPLIVLSGASGRTLAFGPGHTEGSAAPGAAGTAIVSGHRDTHFAGLRDLRSGDELRVERPDGGVVRYRIEDLAVVDARTAKLRAPATGRALVLVTCWPFDAVVPGGPLRYVATARATGSMESGADRLAPGSRDRVSPRPVTLSSPVPSRAARGTSESRPPCPGSGSTPRDRT